MTEENPIDVARVRREDRARQKAYDEGHSDGKGSKLRHRKPDVSGQDNAELDEHYRDAYAAGRKEQMAQRRSDALGSAKETTFNAAKESSGFILGLLAYAVALNFLRGGAPQVNAWLKAKFLNRTSTYSPGKDSPTITTTTDLKGTTTAPKSTTPPAAPKSNAPKYPNSGSVNESGPY